LVENLKSSDEETELSARVLLDKRTRSGKPLDAAGSVRCANAARVRARHLRERGDPIGALVFSHHAGMHMLRARVLAQEGAA
jgi:hypothetical protein